MVLDSQEQIEMAFEAALQAGHVDHVPEITLPDDPMHRLMNGIYAMRVLREMEASDVVALFNTYCREDWADLGVRGAIADELCTRACPGWEEVET